MKIALFYLVCYGIVLAVTTHKIGAPLRWFGAKIHRYAGEFLECQACIGFWVGLIIGCLWYSPTGSIVMDGFSNSAISWIMYIILTSVGMDKVFKKE